MPANAPTVYSGSTSDDTNRSGDTGESIEVWVGIGAGIMSVVGAFYGLVRWCQKQHSSAATCSHGKSDEIYGKREANRCNQASLPRSKFCKDHTCPNKGCDNEKSTGMDACSGCGTLTPVTNKMRWSRAPRRSLPEVPAFFATEMNQQYELVATPGTFTQEQNTYASISETLTQTDTGDNAGIEC